MLYILNLYGALYQLYLNKTGRNKNLTIKTLKINNTKISTEKLRSPFLNNILKIKRNKKALKKNEKENTKCQK